MELEKGMIGRKGGENDRIRKLEEEIRKLKRIISI